MPPKIGYLLPTREQIMEGRPDAAPLLRLAEQAEGLGYDSVWIGDSLISRPRHEPLTLMAGVAGRTSRVSIGTAVLLPALRHPLLMAQQIATVDQVSQGRVIIGAGIAQDLPAIRAEFAAADVPFEKRVGRMVEALDLCRALWRGEPVDWDGRWHTEKATVGPVPFQKGGPPIWGGGMVEAALGRVVRHFDGWLPNGPHPPKWKEFWGKLKALADDAGRDPSTITGAVYVTVSVDNDPSAAKARIAAYLERYYNQPFARLKDHHTFFAGDKDGLAAWLAAYHDAGVGHFVIRVAGDHDTHLKSIARLRADLGWS